MLLVTELPFRLLGPDYNVIRDHATDRPSTDLPSRAVALFIHLSRRGLGMSTEDCCFQTSIDPIYKEIDFVPGCYTWPWLLQAAGKKTGPLPIVDHRGSSPTYTITSPPQYRCPLYAARCTLYFET